VPSHLTKSLHDSNFAFTSEYSSRMSAEIITNNIRVAVLAFAACGTHEAPPEQAAAAARDATCDAEVRKYRCRIAWALRECCNGVAR